jgi:hypothetical protein
MPHAGILSLPAEACVGRASFVAQRPLWHGTYSQAPLLDQRGVVLLDALHDLPPAKE